MLETYTSWSSIPTLLTSYPAFKIHAMTVINSLSPHPCDVLTIHQLHTGPHIALKTDRLAQFPSTCLRMCSSEDALTQSICGQVQQGTEFYHYSIL